MKNKSGGHEGIYQLHIDAVPRHFVNKQKAQKHESAQHVVVLHKPSLQVAQAIRHLVAPKLTAIKINSFFTWFKDKFEFAAVSAGVFAVIYVVLNWGALSINIQYYWEKWRGFENPIEALFINKPAAPERLLAAGASAIPPLDIEVFPPDMRIVIPRINQNVPVIGVKNENLVARRWDQLEKDIQNSLRSGVVHYPGTALPGDNGNVVVTGHSSYYAWDPGRFKDVFALLHDVRLGDKVIVYFNQKKFIYEVDNIKIVYPKDVDVLSPSTVEKLTLITCTPIGTNLKRLIVSAKLIEKS